MLHYVKMGIVLFNLAYNSENRNECFRPSSPSITVGMFKARQWLIFTSISLQLTENLISRRHNNSML